MDSDAVIYLDNSCVLELQGDVIFNSTPSQAIEISGYQGVETLLRNGADICFENVYLFNLAATGTANWIAAQGCLDLGNNSGFNWNTAMPCAPVSVEANLDENRWQIGPNPLHPTGTLKISHVKGFESAAMINLFDLNGRLVKQFNPTNRAIQQSDHYQIQIPSVNAGIYIVEIRTEVDVWRGKLLVVE